MKSIEEEVGSCLNIEKTSSLYVCKGIPEHHKEVKMASEQKHRKKVKFYHRNSGLS
jgi:uncharacterized protein involved in tolerance to divalent cations